MKGDRKPLPPLSALREVLDYDPDTGFFTWKRGLSKARKGAQAGYVTKSGYVGVGFQRVTYLAHRVAWLFVHGEPVPAILDHINGDKTDNRIVNLRAANPSQNTQNTHRRRVNDGKPWLDSDVFDLVELIRAGSSIEETAIFLLRAGTVDDVRALAKELRLI